MAKKKRKKEAEAEKYEFVPPDFDEKQFLKDEMKATKRTILNIVYAALFGALAAGVTSLTGSASLGLLLMIVGIASLKYVYPVLGIDISKFTKRNWLESGAFFFLTFMAIWILMFNPPFSDHADPTIENVSVSLLMDGTDWIEFNYSYDSESARYLWRSSNGSSLAEYLNISSEIAISARISDISGIEGLPKITVGTHMLNDMTKGEECIYTYHIVSLDSSYLTGGYFTFSIFAEDTQGNANTFQVDNTAQINLSG